MMVAVGFIPRAGGQTAIRRGATLENFISIRQASVMANTFTCLHYHVIFSTKNREPWISRDIEERIWKFLGGIARENGMKALQIGGMPDHIHLALALPPTQTVSKALQLLKGGSSKWIKDTFPNLRGFAWQDGYAAFGVSKSNLPGVITYIQNQREHHRIKSFQEEFLSFLKRHEIEFDERYLWG
jgi:REP element-mobilizing transposase RayT